MSTYACYFEGTSFYLEDLSNIIEFIKYLGSLLEFYVVKFIERNIKHIKYDGLISQHRINLFLCWYNSSCFEQKRFKSWRGYGYRMKRRSTWESCILKICFAKILIVYRKFKKELGWVSDQIWQTLIKWASQIFPNQRYIEIPVVNFLRFTFSNCDAKTHLINASIQISWGFDLKYNLCFVFA